MIKTTTTQRADAARRYWQGRATLAELAAELGISEGRMSKIARAAAPRIRPQTRRSFMRRSRSRPATAWTPEEEALLEQRVREGIDSTTIARELYRTPAAVMARVLELGGPSILRAGLVFSHHQLQQTLNVSDRALKTWRRDGLLVGRRNGTAWLFPYDAVVALLQDRRSWMVLRPHLITDVGLRAVLLEAQTAADGRWLTIPELAAEQGVSEHAVEAWVRDGLPAIRYGNVYIWSTDVAPWRAVQPGRGSNMTRAMYARNQKLWTLHCAGKSIADIADTLGLSCWAVAARLRRLQRHQKASEQ